MRRIATVLALAAGLGGGAVGATAWRRAGDREALARIEAALRDATRYPPALEADESEMLAEEQRLARAVTDDAPAVLAADLADDERTARVRALTVERDALLAEGVTLELRKRDLEQPRDKVTQLARIVSDLREELKRDASAPPRATPPGEEPR